MSKAHWSSDPPQSQGTWVGSLEEAKLKCVEDHRCELVCYHSKTGRVQLYQNIERALKEVEGGRKGWKEILQKAPYWQEDGWVCLKASPECRRRAFEIAQRKKFEGQKETRESLNELQLLQKSLYRVPPTPFQPQGSLSHDSADFLGKMGFPMGPKASELRSQCTDLASQLANARFVDDLSCSDPLWVKRSRLASQDRWQECCPTDHGLDCAERVVLPASSCDNCQGVCLDRGESYCLDLGAPGSWQGSGGRVVELMSLAPWPAPWPKRSSKASCASFL